MHPMAGRMTVGKYLKQKRLALGLSLREVARRSGKARLTPAGGISWTQLRQIEEGITKEPGISKLATLARIYRLYLADLTAFFDHPNVLIRRSPSEFRKLLKTVPEAREIVNIAIKLGDDDPERVAGLVAEAMQRVMIINDALDADEDKRSALIPADKLQPPLSITRFREAISPSHLDGKRRQYILGLILALDGEVLGEVFWAVMEVFFKSCSRRELRAIWDGPFVLMDRGEGKRIGPRSIKKTYKYSPVKG